MAAAIDHELARKASSAWAISIAILRTTRKPAIYANMNNSLVLPD
jgi:hypothetical protein